MEHLELLGLGHDKPLQLYHHWLRYLAPKEWKTPYKVVPVSCQSAFEYMSIIKPYEQFDGLGSFLRSLPSIMSPWPASWFEYRATYNMEGEEVKYTTAALIHSYKRQEYEDKFNTDLSLLSFQGDTGSNTSSEDITHVLTIRSFLMTVKTVEHPAHLCIYLDDYGSFIGTGVVETNDAKMREIYGANETEAAHGDMLKTVLPALLSIAWIHTSRVKVVESRFSKRDQKMLNRGKILSHRKVIIKAFKDQEKVLKWFESTGKLPLHMVRGHFKDWRRTGIANNPNARGIYWVPAHFRGNPEKGTITKEYDVQHPKHSDN